MIHQFNGDDGSDPMAGLVLSGRTRYGTANNGGSNSNGGVVFGVNTDGTGFTNLHTFSGGSDGGNPANAGLILSSNTLYGTTFLGGTSSGYGTVFKIETDGSRFANLYSFTPAPNDTNNDGAFPPAGVILSGSTLYGTAGHGGWGSGTLFAINTNGSGFTTLHKFTALSPAPEPYANSDGSGLQGGLVISGDRLYGVTIIGGSGYGTIFGIPVPPQLSVTTVAGSVILSWPTNATGFVLQSATDWSSSTAWTTVSQQTLIVNGQNTITLSGQTATPGLPRFYRLIH